MDNNDVQKNNKNFFDYEYDKNKELVFNFFNSSDGKSMLSKDNTFQYHFS